MVRSFLLLLPAMQILIAPTAFKGTMSPATVAAAIAAGLSSFEKFSLKTLPLADGGDGTIETLHATLGGQLMSTTVRGALGQQSIAQWLLLDQELAVVELSSACGIAGLAKLDAMGANTYGLGEVVSQCLDRDLTRVAIATGGSASTDGGMGALAALGVQFLDGNGQALRQWGGEFLGQVNSVSLADLHLSVAATRFSILTDVSNPLLGAKGAARIFAPQKGASAEQVAALDAGLTHYAGVLESACQCQVADLPGAGSAGGTAFGLACVLGAEIESGFDWIARRAQIEKHVSEADLVITGEGSFDRQSLDGKVIGQLADLCRKHGKRLWVVAPKVDPDLDLHYKDSIERVIELCQNQLHVVDSDYLSAKMAEMANMLTP